MKVFPIEDWVLRASESNPLVGSFGWVRHDGAGLRKFHRGVDLLAPVGTKVVAAHAGYVSRCGWQNPAVHGEGFGLRVYLNFRDAKEGARGCTLYAHLDSIAVAPLQSVEAGDMIGYVGRTGNVGSDPAHLHFEVRLGGIDQKSAVNPLWWLTGEGPRDGVPLDHPELRA